MAYHRIYYTNGTMVVLKAFRHREGTASDWIPYKERCDVTRRMAATFNTILAKKTCDTKVRHIYASWVQQTKLNIQQNSTKEVPYKPVI
jgi:hypothetical protein